MAALAELVKEIIQSSSIDVWDIDDEDWDESYDELFLAGRGELERIGYDSASTMVMADPTFKNFMKNKIDEYLEFIIQRTGETLE